MTRFMLTAALAAAAFGQRVEFAPASRQVLEERLKRARGFNQDRQDILKEMFEEAGCRGTDLADQPVKDSRAPNLICTLPGAVEDAIVVGAHFDRVANSAGIVDNWSGASLLPTLYQSLKARARHHTYVFIGFTDEEEGLVGSEHYVKQLSSDQRQQIRAMVNIDTLALGPTKIWASRADPALLEALLTWAGLVRIPVAGVNVEWVATSDSQSFFKRKIPSIDFHSVTERNLHILHTTQDMLSAVQWDDYFDSYRLIAGYLAYLDWRLRPPASAPIAARLFHVQGIDIEGGTLWVTSVDKKSKKGYLHRVDLQTGALLDEAEVQEGERYHPGGISLDGDSIWVPVAEYHRGGRSSIQRRDKNTLKLISRFEVEDHIGCVAAGPDGLYGGNWDAADIYTWDRDGRQVRKLPNKSGNRYQDMKLVGGQLVASGLIDKDRGGVDWLDLESLKPVRRLTFGKTDRRVHYNNEGMTLRNGKLFLLAEDGPSRLFAFDLLN